MEDLGRVGRDNLLTLVRTLRAELEQARKERSGSDACAGRLLSEDTEVRRVLGAMPHETTKQAAERLSDDVDEAVETARQKMIIDGCLTCSGGKDYKAMLDNLTSTQARCTELLEENRELRRRLETT